MQLLHTQGQVEAHRLAEQFGVSVVTIRRDLETLQVRGSGAAGPRRRNPTMRWDSW